MSNASDTRCYLYDPENPLAWGDCCDELSIIPKPIWVVLLLSVPIEAVLAGADVKADATMYEKKSNQTAVVFLLYNLVTLTLLAVEFDWASCETTAEGVWECYQGLLFMFYNSTAALASMTLWTLIIMRKFYPQMYFVTRLVIMPKALWRWFDRLNLKTGGTHATIERWRIISASTKLYWYNQIGIVIFLLFGGISHILPMFFAYPFVMIAMFLAMVYSHSVRLGYASLESGTNLKSTFLNVVLFYPCSLVLTLVCLALSPLAIVAKFAGWHPMDRSTAAVGDQGESDQLQILVRTEGGAIITLDVDRSATVQSLLPEVKGNLGLAFDRKTIHLKFNDALLDESPGINLDSYGLGNGDVLELVVEPDKVEITVQMENGDVVVVTLNADLTVEALMVQLQTQTGILVEQQWLFLNGERLDMDRVLRTLETTQLELFDLFMTLEIEINGAAAEQVIVRRDALYEDLRESVAAVSGLNADDIEILFNDQVLDETLTLHAQGIRNGSLLVALSTPEEDEDEEEASFDDEYAAIKQEEEQKRRVEEERERAPKRQALPPAAPKPAAAKPPPEKEVTKKEVDEKAAKKKKKVEKKGRKRDKVVDDGLQALVPIEEETTESVSGDLEGGAFGESVEEEQPQRLEEEADKRLEKEYEQITVVDEKKKKKEARKERARERRRRIRGYIKDVLRNLCMFDPNGKVIMFAAATTFLAFTFSANYGLLLYSGAPYIEAIALDWNARSSLAWFSCTAENFVDTSGFGLLDFLGLAIGTTAALFEFVDFLITI